MLRPNKLAEMAREAKKIKTVPLKASAAAASKQQQRPRPGGLAHFRVLESPGCRRVVLTGPSGRLDGKAAESLMWKLLAWENNYLVKAVMLQGRRDGAGLFSGGWDRGGKEGHKTPQEQEHALQRFSQLSYLLTTLSKPTVAWLNGEVRGSGLGLGLARCRVATRSSSFRVDGAKRGWALDGGLAFALPRLRVGGDGGGGGGSGGSGALAMARYLALTGAPLSGADMLACGMATHLMDDAVAGLLHKRMADLTYEPDHMVEEALAEHATMFYKVDSRMNPSPYRDLWADWARNDEARERMVRAAAGGGMGGGMGGGAGLGEEEGDGEEEEGEADQDPFKGWNEDEDGMLPGRMQEEARAAEEEFAASGVGDGAVQARLDKRQLLARHGLLEEEDGGMRGGGGRGGQSKAQQREAAGETEGSLWWHRNFAPEEEALVRAQMEAVGREVEAEVLSPGTQAALAAAEKFTDGRFPEYFTYPERRLLVEGDRLLLSPWDCSVDRAATFPDFAELAAKVEKCFGPAHVSSLEEVVEALKADGSPWATECLRHMDAAASPLSLRLAFQQLEASTAAEVEECFRAEYRVGARLLQMKAKQSQEGGVLARLAEAPAAQAEEMVSRPLEGKEGRELFLPERVMGEVRAREGGDVERRFVRLTTTKGGV